MTCDPEFCSVCGGDSFLSQDVIWSELAQDWELTPVQLAYINRQQGTHCAHCKNNLRSISFASALLNFDGNLLSNQA